MANFPFVVGDSLRIGDATLSATGNVLSLPSGTQVGSTPVATTTEVSTGGGPKITNLQITDNSWAVLDDTAVDTAGGYILITGTNFVSGALVYFNQTPATSVAFVSATTLQVTVPALTAGTYIVYVINPDGGTAIRVPGLTASANPAWQTASALPEQYDGVAITLNLVATEATGYTLVSGALPPGLSLNANTGVITGTVTGVTVDTVYTFTVLATDAQLQDSPRTFTVTVAVSDAYFRLTTLLLSGSAVSANTVVRDSSTNNFNLTVFGDARASNFTPYGTGWSVQLDGTGDYLSIASNAALDLSADFTVEGWFYAVSLPAQPAILAIGGDATGLVITIVSSKIYAYFVGTGNVFGSSGTTFSTGTWVHFAWVRSGSTHTFYINGTQSGTTFTSSATASSTGGSAIGRTLTGTAFNDFNGYVSNVRILKGTALYTANFTPATTNLTAVANTSLLTCNANRFLDSSTNNFTITRNGDAKVVSFNPFNITNTGVAGSMYFDGTGDYVQIANSANLAVGAGDFTIECWVNTSTFSLDTYYRRIFTFGSDAANNLQLLFFDGTNAVSTVSVYSNTVLINGTITVANGAWHHVALCRSGTSLKLFVDGVQSGSTATTSQNFDSAATNGLYIGRFTLAGGHFLGFMSDFRVVKGTALYTTNFTPPTSPLTAIANTQLLTLQYDQPHNNHTFLDSSSNQFVITRSGNATQGTFSPFSQNGWSYYFNGTASASQAILTPTNAQYAIGTGQFSIEAWVYVQSKSTANGNSNHFIISQGNNANNLMWGLSITDPTNYISWGLTGSGITLSAYPVTKNTWNHIVVTRNASNEERIFLNGTLINLRTNTTNYSNASSTQIQIGTSYDTNYPSVYGVSSYGNAFSGYISQLRLDIGGIPSAYQTSATTVGQNIFTPATTSVIATSNTKLLIGQDNRFKDNSTINAVLTPNGNTSVQAFSPFVPTAVYNPAIHGGSGYFNGVSYLSIANTALIQPSAKDFTFECWFYQTQSSIGTLFAFGNPGIYAPLNVYVSGTGINVPLSSTGSSWDIEADTSITAPSSINSWNHIAVSRTSSTVRVFLNGTVIRTTTGVGTLYTPTEALKLGARVGNDTPFYGYISGWRWTVGTGFYTSNFTPSTSSITATTNTQLLLNFTDAAILDSTGRNVLETVADAKSSSVITKFTGGSMYFDGSDYIQFPVSDNFYFYGSNFTIEGWVYANNVPAGYTYLVSVWGVVGQADTTYSEFVLRYNNSNLEIVLQPNGGASLTAITGTGNGIVANAWQHLAAVRNGNNVSLYINGSSVASATYTQTLNSPASKLVIGAQLSGGAGATYFTGYINDLRITKGYARYTANFTAPTAPARLK